MANVTYKVVKGDTLSEIAHSNFAKYGSGYSSWSSYMQYIVKANDIANPDRIVVGQVLIISGEPAAKTTNKTSRATIQVFGLQSNTDRTVYATWKWDKSYTEHYETKWVYATGDGVGFIGDKSTTTDKQSIYNAPSNATHVAFYVRPISKTRKVNGKETKYWTADWSTVKKYYFKDNPPATPPVPTVEVEDYTLTASLDNLDLNATEIQFQIVKDDKFVFNTGKGTIKTSSVSYACTLTAGHEYKVRCRAIRGDQYSNWSEYSDNYGTIPSPSEGIIAIKALSKTSVSIDWENVKNAKTYEIQYTTDKRYFDSSSEVENTTVDSVVGHAEITGLEPGNEYFFRVRSANDKGESDWTSIKSIILGEKPSAPTTWSSTTTVIVGEPLNLYWVHNSVDGSSQTQASLELDIDGITYNYTINNSTDEDEKDKTSVYEIDTSKYTEGTKILWRVMTRGITEDYSEWSVQRTVDVYAPPTLSLVVNNSDGDAIDTLTSFPCYVSATMGPSTQSPIGCHIAVVAEEGYETVDSVGNVKMVKAGESVYSKHFDVSTNPMIIELSANSIDLQNNITYTVRGTASMNSGLTAESTYSFTVAWTDNEYEPNAEIGYDKETFSTFIRPYCENEYREPLKNVTLSVYRREFDGTFTELATGLDNEKGTFIVDPHPSLDFARYRVVATTINTGAISYSDIPGYPIDEKAVIIQWDAEWTDFEVSEEDESEKPAWSGSLLRLPYNIDVSENNSSDVSLVKYIGRQHPVTYYGTQLGVSSTWNVVIPKSDKETLYALRRLSVWMGDVYVREPSGLGYWANVSLSFNQTHRDPSIPVTINVTRVDGGA